MRITKQGNGILKSRILLATEYGIHHKVQAKSIGGQYICLQPPGPGSWDVIKLLQSEIEFYLSEPKEHELQHISLLDKAA